MPDNQNESLARLEAKLDTLHDLLSDLKTTLAIVQDRQNATTSTLDSHTQRLTTFEGELRRIEAKTERWINIGIGCWGAVCVIWTIVTFLIKH